MSISADDFEQKIESVRRKLTLLEENGKVIGKRQDRIDSLALDFLSRWQNFMTQRLNVFNFNLQVKVGKRKFSLALKVIFIANIELIFVLFVSRAEVLAFKANLVQSISQLEQQQKEQEQLKNKEKENEENFIKNIENRENYVESRIFVEGCEKCRQEMMKTWKREEDENQSQNQFQRNSNNNRFERGKFRQHHSI
jgi:ABC-type lipoprotein release transport system permease subunit